MAGHDTTQDFFRQIPNKLLARYFNERELFTDLDFPAMKETKPDVLFPPGSILKIKNETRWMRYSEKSLI